jgi:hypothetical protein
LSHWWQVLPEFLRCRTCSAGEAFQIGENAMNIIDMIEGQGGRNLSAFGKQFGLDERQSRAAVEQLAPVVMAGLRRNSQSAEGVSGLVAALASGGHGRYLEGDVAEITDDGNAILGHVFGSKDVSRGLATEAAGRSGLDANALKKMLPVIAAMVMGALSRNMMGGNAAAQSAGTGGLGDILGAVLGGRSGGSGGLGNLGAILQQTAGGASGASPSGGGLADVLGGLLGGGSARAQQQQSANGGIGDVLNSIFGGGAAPGVREEATRRATDTLGGMLGGGTADASGADELLSSLTRSFGRR